jgi:hypothetical protein
MGTLGLCFWHPAHYGNRLRHDTSQDCDSLCHRHAMLTYRRHNRPPLFLICRDIGFTGYDHRSCSDYRARDGSSGKCHSNSVLGISGQRDIHHQLARLKLVYHRYSYGPAVLHYFPIDENRHEGETIETKTGLENVAVLTTIEMELILTVISIIRNRRLLYCCWDNICRSYSPEWLPLGLGAP